jgi:hypothetical protein
VGIDRNTTKAAIKALLCAVNRLKAQPVAGEG